MAGDNLQSLPRCGWHLKYETNSFMSKKVTIILPPGEAVWPKLAEVDVYQPVDKKGRPSGAEKRRYLTRVRYNDDNFRKTDEYLKQQLKEFDLEDGKLPWKKDKKTGELHLEATSGEKFRPPVYDAKGNALPLKVVRKIGGGSVFKLDVTVNPYTGFGGGINLYINSIQLIELKEKATNRFEETEGFVYNGDDDDDEETTEDNSHPDSSDGEDDEF